MAKIAVLSVSCAWRFTFKPEAFLHLLLADFFFSLYFPGSLVSDKQYCYFQYTQGEVPGPEEFLYNAIKAEDGRVYVGVPSQDLKSTLTASTESKQSDKVFRTSTPRFPNFHLHGRL